MVTAVHNSRAGGVLLLRHAPLRSLLLQPPIELLNHLLRPTRINLSGRVLALSQHRVAPLIHQPRHFGLLGNSLRQVRGDKGKAFRVADDDISWHHRDVSDPNGDVDPRQHDILKRGRIGAANKNLKTVNLLETCHISHRAIHDEAIVAVRVHRGAQIVADHGSVANLTEKVYDQHVSRLKNVDDPRVFIADAALLFAARANDGVNIGSARHEDCGDDASDQPLARINNLPSRLKLVAVARVLQNVPCFVGSYIMQALKYDVRDLWASIGKTF